MKQRGISAYVLPKADEFMSAYLPKDKDKVYKLTKFTGSNGMVVVYADGVVQEDGITQRKPLFITDSRYKLQSSLEVDKNLFDIQDPDQTIPLTDLLAETLSEEDTVALDGSIFPIKTCQALREKLTPKKIKLKINLGDQQLIDEASIGMEA